MSRQLLEHLLPAHWDDAKPGSGFPRVRWLQGLSDLVNRPVINRATASTNATAIACNGAVQSTGIGTQTLQPKRYAELTVKARVTFNLNSAGPAFHYIYRTLGAIPANGAAPNAGDVIVGGDSFLGGPTTTGVNQAGAFSFLDSGLDVSKSYRYYLAVKAPNGNTLNVINASQLLVMERS
jgi:hypothetical protein